METVWNWVGPGWYAGYLHQSYAGDWVSMEWFGDDRDNRPDLYGTGYGTPTWYEKQPK